MYVYLTEIVDWEGPYKIIPIWERTEKSCVCLEIEQEANKPWGKTVSAAVKY